MNPTKSFMYIGLPNLLYLCILYHPSAYMIICVYDTTHYLLLSTFYYKQCESVFQQCIVAQ